MMEFFVQWEDGSVQPISALSCDDLKSLIAGDLEHRTCNDDEFDIAKRIAAILLKERGQ